jgi:hypothetical protein
MDVTTRARNRCMSAATSTCRASYAGSAPPWTTVSEPDRNTSHAGR